MMLDSIKPRVAIYIRVSTHYQIDKDSLPMQREDLTNYCKYIFNTDEYEIFEDAGYSGKDTGRPAFQEMMIKIRKKEFTHILVWKIDRISRNLLDFSTMYEELKKYGVTFVSKNEQFDTSTAMGEAMLKIILVFAELERKLTSERVSATMLSRAVKGLWNGANVPLGYEWNDIKKFPVPCKDEVNTVRKVFEKYIELRSCKKVAVYMNNEKMKTKRGGLWGDGTIRDIIRNPFYIGTYRYNYRESGRGPIKPEKEWIIKENNHEAIIDYKTWQKANEILDENRKLNGSVFKTNKYIHIFSKKVTCNKCGALMAAFKDKPRKDGYLPSQYRCSNKMKNSTCDAKLISDKNLGPFVFNFIKNVIDVSRYEIKDIKDFEYELLKGEPFSDVLSINKNDIELLYIVLYKTPVKVSKFGIESIKTDKNLIIDSNKELLKKYEKIKNKKIKLQKALTRLEDLYLFGDDGISKVDYVIKKKKMENEIDECDKKISEYFKINNEAQMINDMSFLLSFEKFIIKNSFDKDLNFREICSNTNNSALKELTDYIVQNIGVLDGKIMSITFKNGLVINFIYD
ncbi:recombinase family protein [Peptostreptococcus porci]|uniref:recombinase family protein n=1 Tax=Peptostreptococcus porci TaxID=2652282 RepID=UPI0023F3DEC0|nr:recombinase family protein [Peptostreptococcus porci]MDD7182357.1 recombinase family protein [Peptostreptococcus porci]